VFFKNFAYDDGFLGVGCNRNSMVTAKDGSVWIGTNDRLTIFHPESIIGDIDSIAPRIQLTNLELFNEKIPWLTLEEHKDTTFLLANGVQLGNYSFTDLSKWYGLPNHLELAHDNNYLTFQFIGITTNQPKKVKYQYMLDGMDPGWNALTSRSYATYGNLPHGSYTFKVKAMSSDGYWSETLDYPFTIRRPWWLMWWMYALYAITIIGGVMGFTKWRERTLRRRYLEMESINEKLSDLTQAQQNTLSLFIKYVPETIVKKALEERPDSIFEGEQQEVAVLFCDIRDFTPLSEKLTPNEIVTVLNTYYAGMNEVVRHHGGIINQFVGDEIFVIFGAPVPLMDIEERAVLCALDMIQKLKVINRELRDSLGIAITVGIGINYGPVVTGNLGCEDRISYSVTGDTVNTANRIENLTREKPNSILISESVYTKVHHLVITNAWEPVVVKGKNEKLRVYEVVDRTA
jgi:class 3 adenylate cyclase